MLTIPTEDLVGILKDAALFAFPKDDLPDVNVVRLEWTGEILHAWATDTVRSARSSWHPDDDRSFVKNRPEPLFSTFGSADPRWVCCIRLDEVKEIIKDYTLPAKEGLLPLTVDHYDGRLRIERSRDTGHPAKRMDIEPRMADFPDLSKVLDAEPDSEAVGEIDFIGRHLADLGAVRQRGLTHITFCGPLRMARVTIGDRFVATIRPQINGTRPQRALDDDDDI